MTVFRCAIRSLLRARWFAAGATVTFALGVGINVAVFASLDRMLFRRLPYANPDRLFLIREVDLDTGQPRPFVTARYVTEARARLRSIDAIAILGDSSGYFATPELEEPEVRFSHVTHRMLEIAGVRPALGRGFTEEDDRLERPIALLTHAGWQARFAGSPEVLGRRLWHRNGSIQIVGVLPEGYIAPGAFIDPLAVGVTLMPEARTVIDAGKRSLPPTVRLASSVSREAAQAELDALVEGLKPDMPSWSTRSVLRLIPVRDAMFGRYQAFARLVLAGGLLVLIGSSASLGCLFLVRGQSLRWEASVRASLGASPRRLVAEMVAEGVVVCLAGAALALLAFHWSARTLQALLPPLFARFAASGTDWRVLGLALFVAVTAGIASALLPGMRLARADLRTMLQHSDAAGPEARLRSGRWLLAAEAALGVVLVAAAVLTVRSFAGLAAADLGFEPRDTYLVNARPPAGADPKKRYAFMRRVLEDVRREPGVTAAGGAPMLSVLRSGIARFSPQGPECCRWRVTEGYFEALRIPVIAGRSIGAEDIRDRLPVAVLSERGVRRVWPGLAPAAAVGRTLSFDGEPNRQVIGVVRDTRRGHDEDHQPSLYLPLTEDGFSGMLVVARVAGSALRFTTLRPKVEMEAGSTLLYVRQMEPMYESVLEAPRFRAILFGAFALTALLVAMSGLYAMASFEAARRQREVGLRMALGATRRTIVVLVVGDACAPVVLGALAGAAVWYCLAPAMQGFLHKVDARDPGLLPVIVSLLVATSAMAAWLPARRASHTDAAVLLRSS